MSDIPNEPAPTGPTVRSNFDTVFEAMFPDVPGDAPWMQHVRRLLLATFEEHFEPIVLIALKMETFDKERAGLAAGKDQADHQCLTPEESKESGISEAYAGVLQEWVWENKRAFRELLFWTRLAQQQESEEAEEVAVAHGWSSERDPGGKATRFVKTIQGLDVGAMGIIGSWTLFDIKAAGETSAADAVIFHAGSFPALVDAADEAIERYLAEKSA